MFKENDRGNKLMHDASLTGGMIPLLAIMIPLGIVVMVVEAVFALAGVVFMVGVVLLVVALFIVAACISVPIIGVGWVLYGLCRLVVR